MTDVFGFGADVVSRIRAAVEWVERQQRVEAINAKLGRVETPFVGILLDDVGPLTSGRALRCSASPGWRVWDVRLDGFVHARSRFRLSIEIEPETALTGKTGSVIVPVDSSPAELKRQLVATLEIDPRALRVAVGRRGLMPHQIRRAVAAGNDLTGTEVQRAAPCRWHVAFERSAYPAVRVTAGPYHASPPDPEDDDVIANARPDGYVIHATRSPGDLMAGGSPIDVSQILPAALPPGLPDAPDVGLVSILPADGGGDDPEAEPDELPEWLEGVRLVDFEPPAAISRGAAVIVDRMPGAGLVIVQAEARHLAFDWGGVV